MVRIYMNKVTVYLTEEDMVILEKHKALMVNEQRAPEMIIKIVQQRREEDKKPDKKGK